jgi:hypothetical protein
MKEPLFEKSGAKTFLKLGRAAETSTAQNFCYFLFTKSSLSSA